MVLIGTLCTQLLLQVHMNQFETLQASFSGSVHVHVT